MPFSFHYVSVLIVSLLLTVYISFLISALGMNPFAYYAIKALIPEFLIIAITYLFSWRFVPISIISIFFSYSVVVTLVVFWIGNYFLSSFDETLSIRELGLVFFICAVVLSFVFYQKLKQIQNFKHICISLAILCFSVILFSFLPNPKVFFQKYF